MSARRAGFTLIEIVVLIVVLSAALVGVLLVFQNTVRASADPQARKQALAIAEALLDEVLLASYDPLPGSGTRADFDDVADYNGYTTSPGGMVDIQGNPVPGLADYNAAVAVAVTSLNETTAALAPVNEAMRVTVTVTGPAGVSVALDGYRIRYAGP